MSVAELLNQVADRRAMPPPERRREIREAAGLSQREIAEAMGVDTSTVHRWESGETLPRGERLRVYLDLLRRLREVTT